MPSFPIVDTHLHIWDLERLRYPWLNDVPKLNKSHLIEDYRRACDGVDVAKMVFLQCECDPAQFQQEVEWVTNVATEDSGIRGIVAWAPLEKGEAATDSLAGLAANPHVRGIRRIIQFETDPEFCLQPDFVRGVQLLADFGMSFDICIKCHQMENTIKLVRRCPDVRFILDHIGKPNIRERELEPWAIHLRELANCDNVWCKVSGLVTEADFEAWTIDDLRPYLEHVFDSFGFHRAMFGGDWPVSTQATEYPRWVQTLDTVLKDCSRDELRRFYVTNAEDFYRV